MNPLHKTLLNQLTSKVLRANTISLYRNIVYYYLILFTLLQMPLAAELWGPNALLKVRFYDGNIFWQSFNLLSHQRFANYYFIFPFALIIACLFSFFLKKKSIIAFVIFFLYLNLYHRTQSIQNAGGDLLKFQLLYLIFMNESKADSGNGFLAKLSHALSNLAFYLSQFQVLLLYIVAAMYKLNGSNWIDGSAIECVLYSDSYSLPFLQDNLGRYHAILPMLTWGVLIFQLTFPILIWFQKVKKITLLIGIVFHLFIAFIMGILDFGILMLLMYLLFCSNDWSRQFQIQFMELFKVPKSFRNSI